MPKFPEFELLFGIDSLLSYLVEVVILSIILTTICWIFRNDIFHKDSLSKGDCPICHRKIKEISIFGNDKDDSNSYIIHVCKCGYNSSPFLYILYNKALERISKEMDKINIGDVDYEKNK